MMEHPQIVIVILIAGYVSLMLAHAPWYAYLPISVGALPTAIFLINGWGSEDGP